MGFADRNGIGQSPAWNSTAIIVVWDDWGGFYDPVAPPKLDNQGGPGFRVAMIVASPYVPANEISHTMYGFGSIIRYIEDNWNLGSLGTTDATSTSIANMFDYSQKPRKFKIIPAKYSREFFLHQKPSGLPVTTNKLSLRFAVVASFAAILAGCGGGAATGALAPFSHVPFFGGAGLAGRARRRHRPGEPQLR